MTVVPLLCISALNKMGAMLQLRATGYGLLSGDVSEPGAQAASLSLSLVLDPIGIEMVSISHLF